MVDGKVIFSKADVHRFPDSGEVERAFAMLKGIEAPADAGSAPVGARSFVSRVLRKMRN